MKKDLIVEIFNKVSSNKKDLSYDQFKEFLIKLFIKLEKNKDVNEGFFMQEIYKFLELD